MVLVTDRTPPSRGRGTCFGNGVGALDSRGFIGGGVAGSGSATSALSFPPDKLSTGLLRRELSAHSATHTQGRRRTGN